jgi:hypothetical protein
MKFNSKVFLAVFCLFTFSPQVNAQIIDDWAGGRGTPQQGGFGETIEGPAKIEFNGFGYNKVTFNNYEYTGECPGLGFQEIRARFVLSDASLASDTKYKLKLYNETPGASSPSEGEGFKNGVSGYFTSIFAVGGNRFSFISGRNTITYVIKRKDTEVTRGKLVVQVSGNFARQYRGYTRQTEDYTFNSGGQTYNGQRIKLSCPGDYSFQPKGGYINDPRDPNGSRINSTNSY